MTNVIVGCVVLLAVFTQSLSGFGSALVAMALLPAVIGIKVATPLVAVVGVVLEVVLVIRYREAVDVRAVWQIAMAAIVGTPVGVIFLSRVDESISLVTLGVVIASYALYALVGKKLPYLNNSIWAYLAGFFGGILGGAYNTAGPPVIIFADCRRWEPNIFKGNLQGYFIIVSLAVVAGHAINGNFTPQVWNYFWSSLPFVAAGLIAGLSLDRWLNPALFRQIVLVLLVITGIRLVFS